MSERSSTRTIGRSASWIEKQPMVTIQQYLSNPCGTLSIPYHKAKNTTVPDGMKIVHDRDFDESDLQAYRDERYFRLYRDMKNIGLSKADGFLVETVGEAELETVVSVINRSYTDLQVTLEQIKCYTQTPVYDKHLWVSAREEQTGICVGLGIADFDAEVGELILEWIQVLPAYRKRGIARAIVNTLLHRAKEQAAFATVSGKADDPTCPERLYRSCGFVGNDIWHVMRKKP